MVTVISAETKIAGVEERQDSREGMKHEKYGISSVAWNLSNKSEASAILKNSCGKVSGFTKEDLSDSGK